MDTTYHHPHDDYVEALTGFVRLLEQRDRMLATLQTIIETSTDQHAIALARAATEGAE